MSVCVCVCVCVCVRSRDRERAAWIVFQKVVLFVYFVFGGSRPASGGASGGLHTHSHTHEHTATPQAQIIFPKNQGQGRKKEPAAQGKRHQTSPHPVPFFSSFFHSFSCQPRVCKNAKSTRAHTMTRMSHPHHIQDPIWEVEMMRPAPTDRSTAIRPAHATRPFVPSLYVSPLSDQESGV